MQGAQCPGHACITIWIKDFILSFPLSLQTYSLLGAVCLALAFALALTLAFDCLVASVSSSYLTFSLLFSLLFSHLAREHSEPLICSTGQFVHLWNSLVFYFLLYPNDTTAHSAIVALFAK